MPPIQPLARRLPQPLTRRPIKPIGGSRAKTSAGSPILLFAEAIVNPGEFSALNVDALRNNTTSYIEIHEIRFAGRVNGNPLDTLSIGPSFADVDLKLNKVKLTNNPVSVALLTRAEGSGWIAPVTGVPASYQANAFVSLARIKLARPIVLAPGEMLEPSLYHRSITPYPISMRIAFAGRALGTKPTGQQWLPYFASFQKSFAVTPGNVTNGEVTVVSSEKDLINAAAGMLRVERLTGRLALYTTATQTDGSIVSKVLENDTIGVTLATTKVKITDSRGFIVARNAAFSDVFDMSRRGWECPFNMAPSGYLIVEMVVPSTTTFAYAQLGYGIIGYREI